MRRLWRQAKQFGEERLTGSGVPYRSEPDLVAGIADGQLGLGLPADGGPLAPKLQARRSDSGPAPAGLGITGGSSPEGARSRRR